MNECVQFSRMWDKLTSKVSQAHLSLAEKKKKIQRISEYHHSYGSISHC